MSYKRLPKLSDKDISRFWSRILKSDDLSCWEVKNFSPTSDPNFYINGEQYKLARIAYLIQTGNDPRNFMVLHHCDNEHCMNISHMFLGTNSDNVQDREAKGRGNHHPYIHSNRKLTLNQVNEIRRLRNDGQTFRELAKLYDVHHKVIENIIYERYYQV